MIISAQRNFAFLHLEKCGGTSIAWSYEPFQLWDDILLGATAMGEHVQSFYHAKFALWKHSSATDACIAIGQARWDSLNTFAMVRNPYQLLYSMFTFCETVLDHAVKSHPGLAGHSMKNIPALRATFEALSRLGGFPFDFTPLKFYILAHEHATPFDAFVSMALRSGEECFLSQASRLSAPSGKVLVKHTFRLEDIKSSWLEICALMGIPAVPLQIANPSTIVIQNRDLSLSLDTVCDIIGNYCEDFDLFDYSFEPPKGMHISRAARDPRIISE